jgi:hypothetical protein
MERARSRLAVAMAAENKITSRERWRYYLETEDRLRRCVREIRRIYGREFWRPYCWMPALELLKQPLPADDRDGEASMLCARLYAVLEIMESTEC